ITFYWGFPGAAGDTVTLKEGENLKLHCTFSSSNATLQWLNPAGFTIFLNALQGKDQRYKLLHYSKGELSIQLSNVTVQDGGIYSCFHYSSHFQSKRHNVQILAAPSHPVLEVSQDAGRGIKLSCYTQGSKPQPQISWLLDNGIELSGDTRHQLGADGKKWSTSSTLRILSYTPQGTASCILQHPALGGERLVASLPFQDLPSPGTAALPLQFHCSELVKMMKMMQTHTEAQSVWDLSTCCPGAAGTRSIPGTSLQRHFVLLCLPAGTETTPSGNGTEEEAPRTEVPPPHENITGISPLTLEQDPESKGIVKKEKNLLLPMLVAALIFVLLIIVLLFLVKLKKAHGVWKRENDVSEQTLESYKSRSNEDSPGHERNGQAVNPKSNMQYITEEHVEPPEKNPETPEKNPETPEKNPGCGRETDV
uniref:Cytotoxic and regulatory T cell molecule n=1 Tax=Catharus ustulatus TaxID=91951 RepID=A0A8C3Y7S5_CATUS